MMYDFDNWRANMVLETLQALDEKWTAIRDAAAANGNEDTAADYGNDMIRLSILREGIEAKAMEAFGANVTKLSVVSYSGRHGSTLRARATSQD